ncbi:hypothetical protein [Sphingomonas sp. VNH70]|uniref:hypothetical protein n=1 Tax=Sphingomonas silueang TaxID=3156617 RepID=UPI0032B3E48D
MERTTPEVTGRPRAVIFAAVAAGPIHVALLLPVPDRLDAVLLWPFYWVALSLGLILLTTSMAVLPVAAATWFGGWLGAHTSLVRHPLAWAATGAATGAVFTPSIFGIFGLSMPFGMTALGSLVIALVARRFIAWID